MVSKYNSVVTQMENNQNAKIEEDLAVDTADEFDRIWNETVLPLIKTYSEKYKLAHHRVDSIERRLRFHFYQQRDIFLTSFMREDVYDIDRHKIASCLMKSILRVRPLYIPLIVKLKFTLSKKSLPELLNIPSAHWTPSIHNKIYYANEYLALSVAINIIDAYIMADDDKEFKHHIIVPDPFPDQDNDYLLDVCIDLNAHSLRAINIVTFANIYFLLEKYSCRRTQCANLQKECRRLLLKCGECTEDSVDQRVKSITLSQESLNP